MYAYGQSVIIIETYFYFTKGSQDQFGLQHSLGAVRDVLQFTGAWAQWGMFYRRLGAVRDVLQITGQIGRGNQTVR